MVHGPTVRSSVNGKYLQAHEVTTSPDGRSIEIATGQPTTLTYEKMSKSKYNGVDPTVDGRWPSDISRWPSLTR